NKLRVIPLGGINEIGENMTVLEYGNDMIVVDCGLGFPDEEMPGIDLVIPDISYVEANKEKLRGIVLTHGHEDHVGAVPYVLRSINPPVYGTKLTLGIVQNKLKELKPPNEPIFKCVQAGEIVRLGAFNVEFIRVNHSIADACCLAIHTPVGTVIHTGDFKLDTSPIEGEMMNITRLGELGKKGVLLLLCESTNAERPGYTMSERKVGESLEHIFRDHEDKRVIIATFSSNVHRVQQIIDISAKHGRKVAVTGRSMINVLGAATELGYMNIPERTLIDISEIKKYRPEQLTLITTGSQGEPMSALHRMAYSDHSQVKLGPSDLVVLSASAIPGNEKLVSRVINEMLKSGVTVLHNDVAEVHVSGHACQEELKLMQALTKPKYFMPVHGEYRHLSANCDLARYMGMDNSNIFMPDLGKVLEVDKKSAKFTDVVPSGKILVDGYGVGDVGNIVLRDRKHLSQDGLVIIVASVDMHDRVLLSGPDVVSRGFVYVRESEDLFENVRKLALDSLFDSLDDPRIDRSHIKQNVKDAVSKFLYSKTKRKPMVLPIIMYV
ncbi:MAG: ribonuclease J, partial [Clostridia bacterium]|nr:ribonuclease J [Clostridia bacterium]